MSMRKNESEFECQPIGNQNQNLDPFLHADKINISFNLTLLYCCNKMITT